MNKLLKRLIDLDLRVHLGDDGWWVDAYGEKMPMPDAKIFMGTLATIWGLSKRRSHLVLYLRTRSDPNADKPVDRVDGGREHVLASVPEEELDEAMEAVDAWLKAGSMRAWVKWLEAKARRRSRSRRGPRAPRTTRARGRAT